MSLQLCFPTTFVTSHKTNASFFPKKYTGLQTGKSYFIQWDWVAKRSWIISKCDQLETKYTMWHTSATWGLLYCEVFIAVGLVVCMTHEMTERQKLHRLWPARTIQTSEPHSELQTKNKNERVGRRVFLNTKTNNNQKSKIWKGFRNLIMERVYSV